jgi:hypothetical protein
MSSHVCTSSTCSAIQRGFAALVCSAVIATAFPAVSNALLQPLPAPKSYGQQMAESIPISTIRGTWRIREQLTEGPEKGHFCKGRLTFRGFVDDPGKGTVDYIGCSAGDSVGGPKGRGVWRLKPAPQSGQILFSARWKLAFGTGTEPLLFRGDVSLDSAEDLRRGARRQDAHIRGDILKETKSAFGSLSEKTVGKFEADLLEAALDNEKL